MRLSIRRTRPSRDLLPQPLEDLAPSPRTDAPSNLLHRAIQLENGRIQIQPHPAGNAAGAILLQPNPRHRQTLPRSHQKALHPHHQIHNIPEPISGLRKIRILAPNDSIKDQSPYRAPRSGLYRVQKRGRKPLLPSKLPWVKGFLCYDKIYIPWA